MRNARDPKLIRARILTPLPAFQPGKSGDLRCNSRQRCGAVDQRLCAARLAVELLQRTLGLDLVGVDANDVTERALRIALGDDELTRRIAHQLVIRKFHDALLPRSLRT